MLKVFYNEKQCTNAETSFSPSAKKPGILVDHWLGTGQPIEVISDFSPVTKEQFYRAHEKSHIDDILSCKKDNGFGNSLPGIARTLPWTSGSFMAAAIHAWENNTITMSPTSGFHHATQNESMGFCTFNGLMVTALELLKRGASKIGILDLDHHFGNGTTDIIEWVASDDMPPSSFDHYTVGGDLRFNKLVGSYGGRNYYAWRGGNATKLWFDALPGIVNDFSGCDIVLFQAGADPHIDDPCHAMLNAVGALTNEQFVQRDRVVFEGLSALGIPVAWNLAGGYQEPLQKVLDIHTITLSECLKVL
jgi:acetoin utilization deacetylase AcuC-like enzyme